MGIIRPISSTKILQEAHDFPLAGHLGIFKTYRQLIKIFFWKGMKEDVQKYVNECKVCQQKKSELTCPTSLLQPFPILEQKWDSISMDFITGLPKYLGKECIYVVVDRLKKFDHLFSVTSYFSAAQVADIFSKESFKLHGLPKSIVSDRDSRFMGAFWKELFILVGTQLNPSTSYHPKTDGNIDKVNQWLEGYLRNYVGQQQKYWTKWLHLGGEDCNVTILNNCIVGKFHQSY